MNRKNTLLFGLCYLIIVVVVYYRYIFGDRFLIFSSLVGSDPYFQYWPLSSYCGEFLKQLTVKFWTFRIGLGTQIFYTDWWLNPYVLFVNVLPAKCYPYAAVYKVMLECLGAALAWQLYLRSLRIKGTPVLIFSLAFGFNGYITLWGQHEIFGVIFTIVPIILYSFELFLKKKKYWPLVLSLTYFLSFSYYFFYMFSIFMLVFAALRYHTEYRGTWRNTFTLYLRLGGCYVVAALLSVWSILPVAAHLKDSPRIGMSLYYSVFDVYPPSVCATQILRLLSNNSLGAGIYYRGPFNYYEAPQLYCGLLALLVIPQILRFAAAREKKLLAVGLVFVGFLMVSPLLSLACNAFVSPTFRHSFVVVVLILYAATRAFHLVARHGHVDRRILVCTYCCLALIPVILCCVAVLVTRDVLPLPQPGAQALLHGVLGMSVGTGTGYTVSSLKTQLLPRLAREMVKVFFFLSVYAGLLYFYSARRKRLVNGLLVAFVVAEIIVLTYPTVNNWIALDKGYMKRHEGYMDYSNEAVAYLKSIDKTPFRMEKTYNSVFLNDSLFQGYCGTRGYVSVHEPAYLEFLRTVNVGMPKAVHNYANGFGDRYMLNTLVGVKYMLSKKTIDWPDHELLHTVGDVNVYRNNRWLPIGFAYDAYLDRALWERMPRTHRDFCFLNGFLPDAGGDQDLDGLGRVDPSSTVEPGRVPAGEYEEAVMKLRGHALDITDFEEGHIAGKIAVNTRTMLFLSVPYNRGWRARINGQPVSLEKINVGFIGLPLGPGLNKIELKFLPEGLVPGVVVSVFTLLVLAMYHVWARRRST